MFVVIAIIGLADPWSQSLMSALFSTAPLVHEFLWSLLRLAVPHLFATLNNWSCSSAVASTPPIDSVAAERMFVLSQNTVHPTVARTNVGLVCLQLRCRGG